MNIPIKEIEWLSDTIADEISVNHNEFPGGCEIDVGKVASNITDIFCIWLKDHDIELT